MATVRQVNVNTDVGVYWLNQWNQFISNVGYIGRDDAQLYYTETSAGAHRLARTDASGRLNYTLIPHQTFDGTLQLAHSVAATPALFFESDLGTGVYSPAVNTIGISTDGVSGLLMDVNRNVTLSANLSVDGGILNSAASSFALLATPDMIAIGNPTGTTQLASDTILGAPSVSFMDSGSTIVAAFAETTTLHIGSAGDITLGAGGITSGTRTIGIGTNGSGISSTTVTIGSVASGDSVNVASKEFSVGSVSTTQTVTTSVATTSQQVIHSWDSNKFKSCVYRLEVFDDSNFYSSNIHATHDGTDVSFSSDVYFNEYSVLVGGVNPLVGVVITLASVGGNVELRITPGSSSPKTILVRAELMKWGY